MSIFIYGNWKMELNREEAVQLASYIDNRCRDLPGNIEVCLFPAVSLLDPVSQKIEGGSAISLGAQNVHWDIKGPYTGETSVNMLPGNCKAVLVGHSERRSLFHETNANINRKIGTIMSNGLKVVLCVGENRGQMQEDVACSIITDQIQTALGGFTEFVEGQLLLAYEPAWAIGSGLAANPVIANRRAELIKRTVRRLGVMCDSDPVPVLYGGSVNQGNAFSYLAQENIEGLLIGGASINGERFIDIIEQVRDL